MSSPTEKLWLLGHVRKLFSYHHQHYSCPVHAAVSLAAATKMARWRVSAMLKLDFATVQVQFQVQPATPALQVALVQAGIRTVLVPDASVMDTR